MAAVTAPVPGPSGLGLGHFEGRSFIGWYRHVTLVTAAHLFIIELRLDPKAAAPA